MNNEDRIKILYIDDERQNLVGFNAHFRYDYVVFLASNITEALKFLNDHPDIRIVFSDQRMPDKLGTDFFKEIRVSYPMPVRILLTAFTDDLKTLVDAINKGNVYRFVQKPWNYETINRVIQEANRHYLTNSLLKLKNKELESAYRELDKFAHHVSHDLRGPLTGILSAAKLALEVDDQNEVKEILSIISNSVEHLDKYILQIQDYYSIKTGEFNVSKISLKDVAQDMHAIYHTHANVKGIDFRITINESIPFFSDEVALRLVLNNLLSNAFKYQRPEEADKFVSLDMSVSNAHATFKVKDNGLGIKEEYLDKIFNLFFRASSLTTEVGSGIGLYNVQNVLEKLGGTITVNSVEREGTEFLVKIPSN
ncbi:HAMP domain-containing histidine kinase [Olivibacter sp. SDN3]|uniref:hybrid sensor histidine kinase/response regulator n=1 Tax=Olivibacter sp. SDN3 TaxID=2764720 RepID=UPI001650DC07|nr:HAMP domain-containing sensor histidine kinase [Olivibacter sp. SDN3]QNL52055.1 HAMP domain-containing histidine kinase [Olivibacter sp. SDN3]